MFELRKYVLITTGLVLLLIGPIVCWADGEGSERVGGTIPVIRKIFVSGGYPDLFSNVTGEDFRAGFRATDEGRVIITVLSNVPWKVSVKAEFKSMNGYVKPSSDLLIKVRDKKTLNTGSGSGGSFNKVFLNFAPLSNKEQALWMGEEAGDHCQVGIDYKVLLSAARDIPGDYSASVTYTISAP